MVQSALAVWGTDKKHFALVLLRFSRRVEKQISFAVLTACYPAQLERGIKKQPSYLRLKLVLRLILGLS